MTCFHFEHFQHVDSCLFRHFVHFDPKFPTLPKLPPIFIIENPFLGLTYHEKTEHGLNTFLKFFLT